MEVVDKNGGETKMKISRSTYEKLVRRRQWLKNTVDDLDKIIKEIDEVSKMERGRKK
jgi:hypothetical protein